MFCPNCGTKNEESAQRCRQCGIELAEKKAAAPKFKGTMMMGNSPFAGVQPGGAAGTPGATGPGAPAPAAPAPAAPAAAAPAAATRAALKGPMVGVAPQGSYGVPVPAAQPGASPTPPAAAPAAQAPAAQPPAGQPPAGQAAAPARSALKGTMIGVAPQGFGAQAPAPAAPAAPAGAPPAAATPSAAPAAEPAKVAPKLKGTMIGVAPQGFNPQQVVAQAAAAKAAEAAQAAAGAGQQATQVFSQSPTEPPAADAAFAQTAAFEQIPGPAAVPGEVNPLGGTMLGQPTPVEGLPSEGHAQSAVASTQPNPVYAPPARGAAYEAPATHEARLSTPAEYGAITSTRSHGPIGKDRNPLVVLLLSFATCGLYGIISLIGMLSELRAFRQKNDISILLFFIPIIQLIEILKLPEKVAEAQRMAGIQNPQVAHPVLYLFFGMYFFPADLNETWAAARRNVG